jgi:hypothetical protein
MQEGGGEGRRRHSGGGGGRAGEGQRLVWSQAECVRRAHEVCSPGMHELLSSIRQGRAAAGLHRSA